MQVKIKEDRPTSADRMVFYLRLTAANKDVWQDLTMNDLKLV